MRLIKQPEQPLSIAPATRSAAKLLSRDETRCIVANTAKLPELLWKD